MILRNNSIIRRQKQCVHMLLESRLYTCPSAHTRTQELLKRRRDVVESKLIVEI